MPPQQNQQLSRNELRDALRDLREDLKSDLRDAIGIMTDRLEGHDGRIRQNERDIAELKAQSREEGRRAGRSSGAKYGGLIGGGLSLLLEVMRLWFGGGAK